MSRLNDGPVCGKCHQKLLTGQPLELDDKLFETLQKMEQLPLVVDFWAGWCGPCGQMAPAFKEAATDLPGVRFAKLDTEAHPMPASQHGIRGLPTLVLFAHGREQARCMGARSRQQITGWINESLMKVS